MKALLINGSPNEKGCTYTALTEVERTLNKNGIETELLWLGNAPVANCVDCGFCRQQGRCVHDDAVNRVIDELDSISALVVGSPVYYASASGQLCSFMDRLFHSCGRRMAGKLGASVVSCRRGGASAAFDRLNKYFTISNMPIVSSQYWNQVHGNTPEEVMQDEEGLQTMRTLAENMAWLIKCIEAGRRAGIELPEYEKRIGTNFIR
ncbi:MAG: flavodoxin family protein [Christensenellales bacterium]|nr:flavodoxin family protein [Clostridium sp.]MDY5755686.1 flavodoxin family protein [Eubacteriales bacterium]MDD5981022.1 flavodoxin family protein [Clostridium sp.]MDD7503544.1 flavodoxin family protein [Clostridium sp.]MDY5797280.1 flavodoxin family protein [Eubacteriales bacterium]